MPQKELFVRQSEKRRTSFGSQTKAGSTFVAQMLTVVTTLKSQQRNVLEFMTQAVADAHQSKKGASLLPEIINE
ncbi:MAG: hypothetical protein PUP91_22670 [Rhizonema sp. PD37]|nr:hypothetical protein [Rhizonema sp. PD37]